MEETMTQDGKEILFDIRHLTHTFETEDGKTFDALSDVCGLFAHICFVVKSDLIHHESVPSAFAFTI